MQEISEGRLVPDLFIFCEKAQYEVKASSLKLNFNIYMIALNLAYNINKLYITLDY